jgi:O-succinylbenzoate synthase
MKIWTHRYELKPREAKMTPRQGALLKVEWAVGQVGYSDLHPWPEFGEPGLDAQIDSVVKFKFTPLVENSMEFNYWDREYRLLKRNAFLGLILPRSHRLVFDLEALKAEQMQEWSRMGFTHIKVKMGRNLKTETEALVQFAYSTSMLWRLDFNGRIPEEEFLIWWQGLDPSVKARLDFIEDPLAIGDLKIEGPWANDWKKQSRAQIRIVKPARETDEDTAHFPRIVFTHSLDHALGQACSLWSAARYYMRHPKRTEVCGLAATDFFEADSFAEAWNCAGPRMLPTEGTGFGFDEILAGLTWERIL